MIERTKRQQDGEFTADVFEDVELDAMIAVLWVRNNLEPEDVFPIERLGYWAEQNGYVEEE